MSALEGDATTDQPLTEPGEREGSCSRTYKKALFVSALMIFYVLSRRVYEGRIRERVPSNESMADPAVADAFNRVATMPQMRLFRRFAIHQTLKLRSTGQAADLGCGPGHLVVELARHAPALQITGIDLSDEVLAQAETRVQEAGLSARVVFKKGDAQQIPLADDSFDLLISTLSLHHWRDPVVVMDEIARVLRPGGSFVILDLRRDMAMPFYLLIWFATRVVVPAALKRINEPLGSRNASYTANELVELAAKSQLEGWQVSGGPLWLELRGTLPSLSIDH